MTTTTDHQPLTDEQRRANERAARWVPENPHALCLDFTPKPSPAAFWCANCGWNQPLHYDEFARLAIATELGKLADAEVTQ